MFLIKKYVLEFRVTSRHRALRVANKSSKFAHLYAKGAFIQDVRPTLQGGSENPDQTGRQGGRESRCFYWKSYAYKSCNYLVCKSMFHVFNSIFMRVWRCDSHSKRDQKVGRPPGEAHLGEQGVCCGINLVREYRHTYSNVVIFANLYVTSYSYIFILSTLRSGALSDPD